MARTAKVFFNNRSQAVRLPKEFHFNATEVYIRKEGQDVVLSPRPLSWDEYLEHGRTAPPDFMDGVTDLPLQVRT